MDVYEATERAYKNGYQQGVKEFAERVKGKMSCIPQHHFTEAQVLYEIDQIAKEMGVREVIERTEFGKLVDGTPEDFKKHCEDKDLGYVSSLRNYIAGAYQAFVKMKEDLVAKVKENNLPEDSEEMKTIKGIYSELMKLEQKSCLCVEIIKERELKD